MLRRLVVLMALMGFSIQSLGAACMMMPNETPDPVQTSLLTEQVDCHGQDMTSASTASITDLFVSEDCCSGNCLMMNCQASTVIDAVSVHSISPNIIQVLPTVQVDPTSMLISVVYRPPILS